MGFERTGPRRRYGCGEPDWLGGEEAADQEPEMMFPVVELLQPGSFVDLFLGTEGGSVVEAMQVGEAGQKFGGVLHVVNAEFQRIHILRVEMDGGFLGGREAAVGAEVERNRARRQKGGGVQQRQQQQEPDSQSPSRR